MANSRWMLGIGYVCLALTVALMSARRSSQPEPSLQPVLRALQQQGPDSTVSAVVLLLNPQDCASRIEALTAWNTLHRSGHARVLGLVSDAGGDPRALETIRSGAGIHFPLEPIAHSRMVAALREMNYSSTPVALVLDSRRRLRMAVPLYEQEPAGAVQAALLHLQSATTPSVLTR